MMDHGATRTGVPAKPAIGTDLLGDLRRKQELLAAACRCLDDHRHYLFFDNLAALARRAPAEKARFLDSLEALEAYSDHEIGVIRRLVMQGGAIAFKELVDLVREIRIQQEIEAMLQ